jgi:hypothetical protein
MYSTRTSTLVLVPSLVLVLDHNGCTAAVNNRSTFSDFHPITESPTAHGPRQHPLSTGRALPLLVYSTTRYYRYNQRVRVAESQRQRVAESQRLVGGATVRMRTCFRLSTTGTGCLPGPSETAKPRPPWNFSFTNRKSAVHFSQFSGMET